MQLDHNFPVDQFPPVIRNAIYEAQQITKAPITLIGASVLGAMSLACQNYMERPMPSSVIYINDFKVLFLSKL